MPPFITFLLFISTALMIASVDIYVPCLPFLRDHFLTNEWMMQFSLMINPLVASIVGFLFGHYADCYGKRFLMLFALSVYIIGSFSCAFSQTISLFLAARFVQAIGAGGLGVMTLSILSDVYTGPAYARHIATYGVMYPVTFALAPLIGAYLFTEIDWCATFYFLAIVGSSVVILFYFLLPETKSTSKTSSSFKGLFYGLFDLSCNKHFMRLALVHSLPVAVSSIFMANSAFIFIEHYHFSPTVFSYIQALPLVANLLGTLYYQHYITGRTPHDALKIGHISNAAFLILATITVFTNSSVLSVTLILMSFGVFNFGIGFKAAASATLTFESLTHNKGMGIAYFSFIRNTLSALSVMVTALFYTGTIIPVFTSMIFVSTLTAWVLHHCCSKKPLNLT